MKLLCRGCEKPLTENLYYASTAWRMDSFMDMSLVKPTKVYAYSNDGLPNDREVKRGLFFVTPTTPKQNHIFSDDEPTIIIPKKHPRIVVSRHSILDGIIPKFIDGGGCCDWSMGHPLKCSCGIMLGGMRLDCYESNSVHFNPRNVTRSY